MLKELELFLWNAGLINDKEYYVSKRKEALE